MGGAFGALGADFGALSNNPAGLGLYRSSEFSFSPSISGVNVETNFQNSINNGTKSKFNISNFGIVVASDLTKKDSDNKWKRINIGFGANRINDFNSSTFYRGFNANNSLVDFYLEELNSGGGINPSNITNSFPFSSALVWESYLVNPVESDSTAYTSVIPDGNVQQDKRGLNPSNTEQIKRGEKQVTNPGLQEPSKQLPQRTTPKLNLQQSNGGRISNESLFEKTALDLDSKKSTQVNEKSDNNHRMVLDQGDDRPSLNSSSKTYTPDNKSRSDSDNRNSPGRPRRK